MKKKKKSSVGRIKEILLCDKFVILTCEAADGVHVDMLQIMSTGSNSHFKFPIVYTAGKYILILVFGTSDIPLTKVM